MLETLRQYATSRLVEAGESLVVRDRHLAWSTSSFDLMDLLLSGLLNPLRDDEDEIDNLRAGFEWAMLNERPTPPHNSDAFSVSGSCNKATPGKQSRSATARSKSLVARNASGSSSRRGSRTRVTRPAIFAQAAATAEQLAADAAGLDDDVRSYCLRIAGFSLMHPGTMMQSFDLSREATEVARRAGRHNTQRACLSAVAMGHMIRGEWQQGERLAAGVEGDAQLWVAAANAVGARRYAAVLRGRFDEARALQDLPRDHPPPRVMSIRLMTDVQLDLAQGRDTGALAHFVPLLAKGAPARVFQCRAWFAGWVPGVWRVLHDEVDAGRGRRPRLDQRERPSRWLREYAVQALLAVGRIDEARAQFDLLRRGLGIPFAVARSATSDAMITRCSGDVAGAERARA